MGNLIFYFSGTGNSFWAAKTIAKELGGAEIVSMGKHGQYTVTEQYETIGFIYPNYYWGLPKKVIEFIENLNFNGNKKAYFYSIATYGGDAGNTIYQLYELLEKKHNIKLNNGQKIRMFSNYVVLYDMKENVDEITKKSNADLVPLIESIKHRKNNKVSGLTKVLAPVNSWFIHKVSAMDKEYNVNDRCTGCGICKEVCPVGNIAMQNSKPVFNHTCEQCVACIQFCPKKAINFKNQTQNRRRYTNPGVNYKELAEQNK